MYFKNKKIREELYLNIIRAINRKENCDLISLIEEQISFIESGNFLEDITYTPEGSIRDNTFFEQKSELIELIKVLPDHISIRCWKILYNKLKIMLPKEVKSFRKPVFGKIYTSQEERSVRATQDDLKKDLFETREFLESLSKSNVFPTEEIVELLRLIPNDDYFKYDAVSSSSGGVQNPFSYELFN